MKAISIQQLTFSRASEAEAESFVGESHDDGYTCDSNAPEENDGEREDEGSEDGDANDSLSDNEEEQSDDDQYDNFERDVSGSLA